MKWNVICLLAAGALLPCLASAATGPVAPAGGAIPSDAEAEAAYAAAQKAFQNTQQNSAVPTVTVRQAASVVSGAAPEVVVYSDPTREMVAGTNRPVNVALENIRVVMDVENDSLRNIMHKVVSQAGRYTGPWQVKWRLKPENAALMDERVNLTAEAKFSDFVDLLTERVKNLTGVQLFVTTFNESRIIMVADTYY